MCVCSSSLILDSAEFFNRYIAVLMFSLQWISILITIHFVSDNLDTTLIKLLKWNGTFKILEFWGYYFEFLIDVITSKNM